MKVIERTPFDGRGYLPAPFLEFAQVVTPFFHSDRNLGHPMALCSRAWRAIESSLEKELEHFACLRTGDESQYHLLLDSHAALISQVAEFIEVLQKKVAPAFIPCGSRLPIPEMKADRRHVTHICNALKHDQDVFGLTMAKTAGGVTCWGYTMWTIRPDLIVPKILAPNKCDALSLGTDIRRVIASAYSAGETIAKFIIDRASYNYETLPTGAQQWLRHDKVLQLFKRVADLPTEIFPWESKHDATLFEFDRQDVLRVAPRGGRVLRLPDRVEVKVSAMPEHGAASIQMPGLGRGVR